WQGKAERKLTVERELAGGIAVFFYLAHRGVREVKELEPTDGERTQILPIREAGKIAGGVVGVIRAIPRAIGYQK
ncbi:MAG: hypothetical protein OXN88_03395, partial [Chloroflexota bacterium]|nr:hypothetical protein [Chloroflexota bacterium]